VLLQRKRLTWALVLAVSGASLALGTQQAEAADVSYKTTCVPPAIAHLKDIHGTTTASLSSSDMTPGVGETVTITWKTVSAASENPGLVALPANVVTPSGKITMAGVQQGVLSAVGPTINPPTPKNSAMHLSDMTAKVKLTTKGKVTFAPGDYSISVNVVLVTVTSCKADSAPAPGLTLTVGAAGTGNSSSTGTASSGTTGTPTTSGSTGSGGTNLAATGGDSSSVQALGLAGGTVLLVGAAVFALTPWRRLRRPR
jgi:hypothetical protein